MVVDYRITVNGTNFRVNKSSFNKKFYIWSADGGYVYSDLIQRTCCGDGAYYNSVGEALCVLDKFVNKEAVQPTEALQKMIKTLNDGLALDATAFNILFMLGTPCKGEVFDYTQNVGTSANMLSTLGILNALASHIDPNFVIAATYNGNKLVSFDAQRRRDHD